MFEEIENYYKKNSRNIIAEIIFRKWAIICFGIAIINFICLFIFIQNKILVCIISLSFTALATYMAIKPICKDFNKKFNAYYKLPSILKKTKENKKTTIIDDNKTYDRLLMKRYLKRRKFYNIEMIKNIIDYYREKHNNKIDNYLTILTIIISLIAIIFSNIKINIIYTILIIASILLIYKIVYKFKKSVLCLNNGLNDKQNIYESLDEIFSEILNEYIIESKVKKKINNNL